MDTHKGTQPCCITLQLVMCSWKCLYCRTHINRISERQQWKLVITANLKNVYNTVYKYTVNYSFLYLKSRYWNSYASTYSYSPSDGAASSMSIGINLPLDGCSGVFFFFFLLTLLRITLAKSLMSSFWVDYDTEYTLTFSKFMKEQLSFFPGELAAGTSFQHVTACSVVG